MLIYDTSVYGFQNAVWGLRAAFQSWGYSDSLTDASLVHVNGPRSEILDSPIKCIEDFQFGPRDWFLALREAKSGGSHAKFLRMITVTAKITAPWRWWSEFDTYKVGTVRLSTSLQHSAHKGFAQDDFDWKGSEQDLQNIIDRLNGHAKEMRNHPESRSDALVRLRDEVPGCYLYASLVQLNYQVLKAMYNDRKNHVMPEWREFCQWIDGLPYRQLITGDEV